MSKEDLLKLKKSILENKKRLVSVALAGSIVLSGAGCSKVVDEGMSARDVCKTIDHTKELCPLTEELGIEHQIEMIKKEGYVACYPIVKQYVSAVNSNGTYTVPSGYVAVFRNGKIIGVKTIVDYDTLCVIDDNGRKVTTLSLRK